MSDKFVNGLKKELNFTLTTNGAVAYGSTGNKTVDLFGSIGALRNCSDINIITKFVEAFKEDALVATKILFYARDIRGGMGERRTFRIILKWMADNYPNIVKLNFDNVVEFGRYDDLFVLFETQLEQDMIQYVQKQFEEDRNAEYPTLLGKWMPSENASSQTTKEYAKKFQKAFGISAKEYRKALTAIRNKLNIVETLLSSKQWDKIDYSKLPSKAAMQYRNAFLKNDKDRYEEYLQSLQKGDAKVNSATLFPYDIVGKIVSGYDSNMKNLYNAQWDALPNYLEGIEDDSLCMVDTSGSMWGQPYNSAVALGLYCAQHNKGRFHNMFMTFDSTPALQTLKFDNLVDNVRSLRSINVGSTNIEKAFDLILDIAIKEHLSQNELPKRLIVMSDMQFDCAAGIGHYSWGRSNAPSKEVLFDTIKRKFKNAGYKMPKLVFWNLNAQNTTFPMKEEDGAQFVSGHSQALFEAVIKGEFLSPIGLVLSVINKERYNSVVVQ